MKKNILLILPVALIALSGCNSTKEKTYESWSDFDNQTFVSVTGTNCEDAVKALIKNPTFIYVDDPSDMATYIRNGDAIAGVTNEPNIAYLANDYEDLDVYPTLLDVEDYGFLLKKGSEYTEKVNSALKQVTNSGDLAEIIDKWIYSEEEQFIDVGEYKVDSTASNTLTLAVDPSFEPCCYKDSKGNYAGYEIELAYLLASTLNYNLEIIEDEFVNLFTLVDSGNADLAVCIITITDQRRESYDFSDSYYTGGVALLMDKEITDPLQEEKLFGSLSDFSGTTVATIGGASGVVDPAKEAIPNLNVKYYRSTEAALDALKGGRVSGLLRNKFNLEHYLEGEDDLMIFPEDIATDYYGYMLPKDSKLTADINSALISLGSSFLNELQSKWINATDDTRIDLDEYKVSDSQGVIRYAFADGNEPFSYTIIGEDGTPSIGDEDDTGVLTLADDERQDTTDPGADSEDQDNGVTYLAGYEVELMYAIAKELNMTLDITVVPAFNDLFDAVETGSSDIVSGGISITSARELIYDFSSEIFEGAISLAIRVDTYNTVSAEEK